MRKLPDMSTFGKNLKDTATGIFKRGRKGVDSLAVVIDEQTQAMRLAARVRQLNRERNELLTEIGRKVYTLHTQAKITNRDIIADCSRIDTIGDQIGSIRRQIDELRSGPDAESMTVAIEDDSPLSAEMQAAPAAGVPAVPTPQAAEPEIALEPAAEADAPPEPPAPAEAEDEAPMDVFLGDMDADLPPPPPPDDPAEEAVP